MAVTEKRWSWFTILHISINVELDWWHGSFLKKRPFSVHPTGKTIFIICYFFMPGVLTGCSLFMLVWLLFWELICLSHHHPVTPIYGSFLMLRFHLPDFLLFTYGLLVACYTFQVNFLLICVTKKKHKLNKMILCYIITRKNQHIVKDFIKTILGEGLLFMTSNIKRKLYLPEILF